MPRSLARKAEYQKQWRAANPDYMNRYMKVWSRKRKEHTMAIVRAMKDKPCADCNHMFPVICMDFDHAPGKKPAVARGLRGKSVSDRARTAKPEQLLAELSECDVVCANCHRIRTERQRHG